MELTQVTKLPTRATFEAAPVGTIYCYRRKLFVWPEPFGFVYLKVAPNAWISAGGRGDSFEVLIAKLEAATELQSQGDAVVAAKLVASEVHADRGEPHHGLFRGDLEIGAALQQARAKEARDTAAREAAIAAHDPTRCDDAAGVKRLKTLLESIETLAATRDAGYVARRGATEAQLAQLERAAGGALPKDLAALYAWADGNGAISLFCIDDVLGQMDLPGLADDELPIIEIGDGDCFVYVVRGRERGVLRTYYNDAEQREPGFPSLLAWAETVAEKLAPAEKPASKRPARKPAKVAKKPPAKVAKQRPAKQPPSAGKRRAATKRGRGRRG